MHYMPIAEAEHTWEFILQLEVACTTSMCSWVESTVFSVRLSVYKYRRVVYVHQVAWQQEVA